MMCYRIVRGVYKADLSGESAEKFGGRWNSIGTRALYCCENRALALLEILANAFPAVKLKNYYILEIEAPEQLKNYHPKMEQLPNNWNGVPMNNATKLFGDEFMGKGSFIGMRVPSTLMPFEYNFVFNPFHRIIKKSRSERQQHLALTSDYNYLWTNLFAKSAKSTPSKFPDVISNRLELFQSFSIR